MDGDIGSMLQSVLSDPEQMAKITQMAKGLMGQAEGGEEAPPPSEPAPAPASAPAQTGVSPLSGGEAKLFSALGKAFSGREKNSRSTALLVAMRPYMRPEKQEKLDRAMKIAQMVHIAGAVMKEYGGGGNGV